MILKVHLQPNAKKNEIVGHHGDAIKIRLKAPAIEGRANAALIEFLAEKLGIARANIQIKSGHTSRQKLVEIIGVDELIRKILQA